MEVNEYSHKQSTCMNNLTYEDFCVITAPQFNRNPFCQCYIADVNILKCTQGGGGAALSQFDMGSPPCLGSVQGLGFSLGDTHKSLKTAISSLEF